VQRFIAELSKRISNGEFEQSWQSDSSIGRTFTVDCHFDGGRATITIESYLDIQWQIDDFHRTFSNAIHRVDQHCNIRWL
jgi:hypothetical protein